jgi:hypothetical protein
MDDSTSGPERAPAGVDAEARGQTRDESNARDKGKASEPTGDARDESNGSEPTGDARDESDGSEPHRLVDDGPGEDAPVGNARGRDVVAGDALDHDAVAELPQDDEPVDDDGLDEDPTATSIDDLGLPMPVLSDATALDLLEHGELTVVGQLHVSSNNALLCLATQRSPDGDPDLVATCIYKPVMGERPLIDFPTGTLARRERAAFVVSEATGWSIVPPTVLRDGPFGKGMLQLWIKTDDTADPVAMVVEEDERLRRIAVFDAAVNNTDRKAGHLLPVPGGHVYGVDHGVTFSSVPKLRTVLWAWRGQPFSGDELVVLRGLRAGLDGALGARLGELLAPTEVRATARRLDALLATGVFPQPDPHRPALPWPPV